MEAILLIMVQEGNQQSVIERLLDTPGVLNAYAVYGAYDVIATIKVEDVVKYQEMLKNDLPGIQLVNALLTDFKKPTRQRAMKRWEK